MTTRLVAFLLTATLIAVQASAAQVFCEFGRHYVPVPPAPAGVTTRHVFVGATFSSSLDKRNQWALGADVTYPISHAFAVSGGIAYCDPKLSLDPKPIFGANVSWRSSLSTNNAWEVAIQIGTSYIAIDISPLFPASGTQKEVTVPGLVALEHNRGAVRIWAGALVQYSRSWTSAQTIRSGTDPGGVFGLDVRFSPAVAAGAGYNFLWFEDSNGDTGILDGLVMHLGYAF